MVYVKGNVASAIPTLTELGLAQDQIRFRPRNRHRDIQVNAIAGGEVPNDVQIMGLDAMVTMNLIDFDDAVLNACVSEAMGGVGFGGVTRAGIRMGGRLPRFAAGNHYIGLNIASPQQAKPYRFYYAYLVDNFAEYPLGVEAQVVPLTWRIVPYQVDPWNNGLGQFGNLLFDNTFDT